MSTAAEMIAVEEGGVVKEDVIAKLYNLSKVDLPLIDSIGSSKAHNVKVEFTDEVLEAPSSTSTFYENQDLSAVDDSVLGLRYFNYCQQDGKVIKLSDRAEAVDTTYNQKELTKQVIKRGEALRRNEEAAAVSRNAATAENPGVAGALTAGMATWAIHNTQRGAGGADAVLSGATNEGGGPTTAPTEGNKRGMTETMLRTALRLLWDDGADPTHIMSTGSMIETISNYLLTSSARTATVFTEVPQSNREGVAKGNGASSGGVAAQGAVNMFVGNFNTVTLAPNRQMVPYTAADTGNVVDVLVFDKRYPLMKRLRNASMKRLGVNGIYTQRVLFHDSAFVPGATRCVTTIADIDPTAAMVP